MCMVSLQASYVSDNMLQKVAITLDKPYMQHTYETGPHLHHD